MANNFMALAIIFAKNDKFIIITVERNIFTFNTEDRTHSIVEVPLLPRKRIEINNKRFEFMTMTKTMRMEMLKAKQQTKILKSIALTI